MANNVPQLPEARCKVVLIGLVTAGALVMFVLLTRIIRRERAVPTRTEDTSGPLGADLAGSHEVQGRLDKSISGLVDNPSPFEEEDAKLRADLAADGKSNASGQDQEWKGAISGLTTFMTVVIRTPKEWQRLWLAHISYIVPPPPTPEVDFNTRMVVGIFDGSKPTAGYAVKIVDVRALSDKVLVTYRESSPPAGQPVAQIVTQPYDLRIIPASSLPVTFEKRKNR
jgi:hypothetical protein